MQITWNNDHASSHELAEGARALMAELINRFKTEIAMDPALTEDQDCELYLMGCCN